MTIYYTAECMQCQAQSNPLTRPEPVVYESEIQRDEEARQHMELTGHTLAVGYIDTDENPDDTTVVK